MVSQQAYQILEARWDEMLEMANPMHSPDEGVGPHYEGSVDRRHRPTDTHEYRNSHPFWKGDAKIATVWKRKSNALKDKHAFVSLSTFSCILRDWDFVAFEGEGIDSFHKDSIMAGTFG
jgi:hypothetical protein